MSTEKNCEIQDDDDWWYNPEIIRADLSAALSLTEFTTEFVSLILKLLDTNPELRPQIDKLCDYGLYSEFIKLAHFRHAVNASRIELPNSARVDLLVRLPRKVQETILSMDEWEKLRLGYIAMELRKALDYDLSENYEMGDEMTRGLCIRYLEDDIGKIAKKKTNSFFD